MPTAAKSISTLQVIQRHMVSRDSQPADFEVLVWQQYQRRLLISIRRGLLGLVEMRTVAYVPDFILSCLINPEVSSVGLYRGLQRPPFCFTSLDVDYTPQGPYTPQVWLPGSYICFEAKGFEDKGKQKK